MEADEFERVIQTTAQSANEVPGVYRLHNSQLAMEQVVERVRVVLAPLGWGIAVRIVKVEEERAFELVVGPPAAARVEKEVKPKKVSAEEPVKAQSGYPVWRRPR